MSESPSRSTLAEMATAILRSAPFAQALTLVAVGAAVLAKALVATIGWPGVIGLLATLVALALVSFVARRREIEWSGVLPISLLVFLGWASLSIIWSQYQWSTLGGLAYLGAFTICALYVALVRDTIQIVRAFGDVLRAVLAASLILEVLSGVLFDTPLRFLGIVGNIDELGPIQGLLGNRNQLCLVAIVAAITFGTELRTRSVSRAVSVGSLTLAAITILLCRSPLIGFVLFMVIAAMGALYGLRQVPVQHRTVVQLALLVIAVLVAALVWSFRNAIAVSLNASGDLNYRLNLWRQLLDLVSLHPLEGWGWIGRWRAEVPPFQAFGFVGQRVPDSALNAFLDVYFQLGLVGTFVFGVLVGLAFLRSWLLAGRRRSYVFAWPALVLVAIITTALVESSLLVEFGWLSLVVCCVKAARELSWRVAFATSRDGALPGES